MAQVSGPAPVSDVSGARVGPRVAYPAGPVVAGTLGAAFSVAAISLAVRSGRDPWWLTIPIQSIGILVLVVGLFVWIRQPGDKRMAWLLVAAGIAWYIGDLQFSKNWLLFRVGFLLFYLSNNILTHLLLAFPSGRLTRRAERVTVVGAYVSMLLTQGLRMLSEKPLLPQIWGEPGPQLSVWAPIGSLIATMLTITVVVLVAQRWRAEPGPVRRARGLYWAAVVLTGIVVILMIAAALARVPSTTMKVLLLPYASAVLLLGVAVLAGSLRTQMAHQRVSRFLSGIEAAAAENRSLQDALAEALEDPTLSLHFRRTDSGEYVDPSGRPAPLPSNDTRMVTIVGPRDRPLAALVHDPILGQQPRQRERLSAVVAAARLALENAAFRAKDQARLRGMLDVELDTRQSIRSMLHDGPQHRLSWLQHQIGQLRERHHDTILDRELDEVADEVQQIVQDLREVTDGVYPSILPMRGLAPALDPLVQRSLIPLLIDVIPGRWPGRLEETAFFVISEAVGNAHKHARATRIAVRVWQAERQMVIEVSDDGIGGATLTGAGGSGLRGLRDRVGAHDGTLVVESPPGAGTTVRVVLPCA